MTINLWPLHVEIFNRLSDIPGFTVFLGRAPQDHTGDHFIVGDRTVAPWDDHGERGKEITETVHIWTRGAGSLHRTEAGRDAATAALEDGPFEVDGLRVVNLEREFAPNLFDNAGWWHIPARFRIHTTEES